VRKSRAGAGYPALLTLVSELVHDTLLTFVTKIKISGIAPFLSWAMPGKIPEKN
jgi:hypothetical protein